MQYAFLAFLLLLLAGTYVLARTVPRESAAATTAARHTATNGPRWSAGPGKPFDPRTS
ncbi:hypothetical protein [Acidovorax sp. Root217]|uniref:hypothetical protein n=1 Tax=Acidovorax sp. Root217 TaxID=1736492 RepID=UPI000AF74BA4|nr:hypothetical protein [Acidovorax sp. Root217]